MAELTGGEATGLHVGSREVLFKPGGLEARDLYIDVGTAGSITLILQAVVPALSILGRTCRIRVRGGTDTKWSPTYNYFALVALPAFKASGVECRMRLRSRGYYPKGGGLVEVEVNPMRRVDSLKIPRPPTYHPRVVSVYSNLPRHVGERQARAAIKRLEAAGFRVGADRVDISEERAYSPGTSVLVYSVGNEGGYTHFVGGDCVGERGVPAERVGETAAQNFIKEALARSSVDLHLADMLIPILAVQSGESEYYTSELTAHMETNAYVTKKFVKGCEIRFKEEGSGVKVVIKGASLIN